jgi:hypothetical protein
MASRHFDPEIGTALKAMHAVLDECRQTLPWDYFPLARDLDITRILGIKPRPSVIGSPIINRIGSLLHFLAVVMFPVRKLFCLLAFASTALVCSAAEHILFTREGPTQARLFISNADGSGERALTQAGWLDYNPASSPKKALEPELQLRTFCCEILACVRSDRFTPCVDGLEPRRHYRPVHP